MARILRRVLAPVAALSAGAVLAGCYMFGGDQTVEAREEFTAWAASQPELTELKFEGANVPFPSLDVQVVGLVAADSPEAFFTAVEKLEAKEKELRSDRSVKFRGLDMQVSCQLGPTLVEWQRRDEMGADVRETAPFIHPEAARVYVGRGEGVTVTRAEEAPDAAARAYVEATAPAAGSAARSNKVTYVDFPFGPWHPTVRLYAGQLPLADQVVAAVPGFEVSQVIMARDGVEGVALVSLSEQLPVAELEGLREILIAEGAKGKTREPWARVTVQKPSGQIGYGYVGRGEPLDVTGDFDAELNAIFLPTMTS